MEWCREAIRFNTDRIFIYFCIGRIIGLFCWLSQKNPGIINLGFSIRRAAELFGIYFATIRNWQTESGRINKEALLSDAESHPTSYPHERRAGRFNCTPAAVHKVMRRYRISENNSNRTSGGLLLQVHRTLVLIDECGIRKDWSRRYGYVP